MLSNLRDPWKSNLEMRTETNDSVICISHNTDSIVSGKSGKNTANERLVES